MLLDGIDKDKGFQYWSGDRWSMWCLTPETAYLHRNSCISDGHHDDDWRGLANEPVNAVYKFKVNK